MGTLRLPYAAGIVMRTVGAGWVAAIYGALYIYATADFAVTGTLWIFGWPFLLGLCLATLCHLILAGASSRLRSPIAWVNAVNEIFAPRVRLDAVSRVTLEFALTRLPSAPAINGLLVLVLSALVVLWMAVLEWVMAGTARNVGPVLVGGTVASLLYAATTFTLSEVLVAEPCQRLRSAAVRRDLDPYPGQTVDTRVRVAILAAPTLLALLVAPRLTANLEDAWLAHTAIVFLATALTVALAWMHALMIRQAAIDLGEAARRLTGASRVSFVTGTIDRQIVDMARAFNDAAGEVDRSQQNAAARYGALFEGAGDAILLVEPTTGAIIEANRRAQELTGLSDRALKATRFEWLFRPGTRLASLVGESTAVGRSSSATIVRADGSERPVDVAVSFVALAEGTVVQAIMHDVAQRERSEQELRTSLARLKELYQLAVTLGGTVEQVAERVAGTLATLLDVPHVVLERHTDDDLVMLAMYENGIVTRGAQMPLAGTPCGRVREDRRAYSSTSVATSFPEDTFLAERGLHSYAGVPIVGRNGDVVGVVAVMDTRVRDFDENDVLLLSTFAERLARVIGEEEYIREREAFVQQLTAQNVALTAAKEDLTEGDRLKSMFMGMMSHELRTPLNIFLGYTELLLDTAREDGARPIGEHGDVLERMLHAAGVLTNLVEDTLSVLRLESTGVRVNREPVVLATLFEELQTTEQALHPTSPVEEYWSVESGLGTLETDRLKIRQIVTNLVGNARKFTTEGSIAVEARSASDGRVMIAVTDTGCGIPPDDLPHIFELYRQAADGETRNGCGIGLFIVQRYCSLLGGRVEVTSELERGTRFTVWLPRMPVPEGAGCEECLPA